MRNKGFDCVDSLESSMDITEIQETKRRIKSGETKILYVSPERLKNESFMALMKGYVIPATQSSANFVMEA